MFGSDWPVCLLAANYDKVFKIVNDYLENLSVEMNHKSLDQPLQLMSFGFLVPERQVYSIFPISSQHIIGEMFLIVVHEPLAFEL